ncbi:unnamed protein product [Rotaria magnacalcarata]|uniref:Uncharacterized protein n=1 Tax=Rotaria magnacalcarata TaxID=392030 RepID=A0A816V5I2_9BILA|nr:unnamed protein product [Rotaria magnacalcarata]
MDLELTCLNVSASLPTIPTINNVTNIYSHSYYNPNGKSIFQLISSALTRSTFSTADVQSFLKLITSGDIKSLDVSSIVKLKPVTSIIIYTSVALALCVVLSVIFCIISCSNCCKREYNETHTRKKNRTCSKQRFCVVFILLIGLIVIGQMLFLTYQVNNAKLFLDDSIKEINQEIYPKEVSIYLEHILRQLEKLDQYLIRADSIVIKASQSLLVKAFNQIILEEYFFDDIRQSVNYSEVHIKELEELINQEKHLLPEVIVLFQGIKTDSREMINYLKIAFQEPCDYANGNDTDIIKIVIHGLDLVHQQMRKLIDTIDNDVLSQITPWQNAMLLNKNLEDKVRWYVRLVTTILIVLIIIVGLIPIVLLIIIITCRVCHRRKHVALLKHSKNNNQPNGCRIQSQSSIEEEKSVANTESSNGSSGVVPCWIRIAFIPIMIILILIVLVTGVFHGIDLLAQGACLTVHNDQPFLVSFFIEQLSGNNLNYLVIDGLDVQTMFTNIIDDCRNHIHFSKYFFKNHLIRLENDIDQAMNRLNEKIFDKFNITIGCVDFGSALNRLATFSVAINSIRIQKKVQDIENNLKTIETQINKILTIIPILPASVVNQTIHDFTDYLQRVLESTFDMCPLPLAIIYQTDMLICHKFATAINGLWLGLSLYMFFITFGLCLCGLCIYKRT